MADRSGYIGRNPGDSSVVIARQTFEPTGIQTDFTFASGYTPGYLDVYINGVRLVVASDYTATDGSVIGLTTYADNGDVLECVAYKAFNVSNVDSTLGNFTVGVDLTVGGDLTVDGSLSVAGAGASVSYATTSFGLEGSPNITINDLDVDGHTELDDLNVSGVSTFNSNVIVGGATTDLLVNGDCRVTGILTVGTDSITINGNTDIMNVGSGITIYASTGIVSATSYYGDGSQLTGIALDSTALKDSNDAVRVQANTSGAVVTGVLTATSFYGDGSNLTFAPKVISFDPQALSTGVVIDKTITITFDQNISFSGSGTVYLRSGSSSGTELFSFDIANGTPDAGLSISGTQLIINPASDFPNNTAVYVILPSTGIVNSAGAAYAGSSTYFFQTIQEVFSAQGGDHVYTIANGSSPTGHYKYHIFTSRTGILTTNAPSASATDFEFMMVAGGGGGGAAGTPNTLMGGGGGGGGVITKTGPTLAIGAGEYPIGVGTGGGHTNYAYNGNSYRGGNTIFSDPTTALLTAIGGGNGAWNHTFTPPGNSRDGQPGGSGGGGSSPPDTSGGEGTPGQGYGGAGGGPSAVTGGGGGAGGVGQAGSYTGPGGAGGNGGPGVPNPAFNNTVLSGYVAPFPAHTLSEIGANGYYGGGGGGTYNPTHVSANASTGGVGGAGGGGNGSDVDTTPDDSGEEGAIYTGGGGGGNGYYPGDAPKGGDGVLMIRYATPAP